MIRSHSALALLVAALIVGLPRVLWAPPIGRSVPHEVRPNDRLPDYGGRRQSDYTDVRSRTRDLEAARKRFDIAKAEFDAGITALPELGLVQAVEEYAAQLDTERPGELAEVFVEWRRFRDVGDPRAAPSDVLLRWEKGIRWKPKVRHSAGDAHVYSKLLAAQGYRPPGTNASGALDEKSRADLVDELAKARTLQPGTFSASDAISSKEGSLFVEHARDEGYKEFLTFLEESKRPRITNSAELSRVLEEGTTWSQQSSRLGLDEFLPLERARRIAEDDSAEFLFHVASFVKVRDTRTRRIAKSALDIVESPRDDRSRLRRLAAVLIRIASVNIEVALDVIGAAEKSQGESLARAFQKQLEKHGVVAEEIDAVCT